MYETITNSIPTFIDGDSGWFSTTQDDGLLYEYTTNLWENMLINPNPTNCYHIFMDAKNKWSESKRLYMDASKSLVEFLRANPYMKDYPYP